jgi:transcriptional regulator with XRE-family HTH domain
MTTEESKSVLSELESTIRSSGVSRREIERRLGMGQGYLNSLFKGRIQLRVAHVYEIARVLGIEPLGLFFGATPPKDPDWLLGELGLQPGKRPPAALLALLGALPREELQAMLREMIRDEMNRQKP